MPGGRARSLRLGGAPRPAPPAPAYWSHVDPRRFPISPSSTIRSSSTSSRSCGTGETSTRDFKQLVSEIATLMAYEATKDLPTEPVEIETPLERMTGRQVSGKKLTLVPILRAGLGMVEGIAQLIPSARVGHIGLYRDHDTLKPVDYYFKIPAAEVERDFFLLDPMLATGGSAVAAVARAQGRRRAANPLPLASSPPRKGCSGCSRPTPTSLFSPPRSTASSTSRVYPARPRRRGRPAVRHPARLTSLSIRTARDPNPSDVLGRRGPGDRLDASARGRGRAVPARRRPVPGRTRPGAGAERAAAVRSPPARRHRAEPRPHRPRGPAPAAGAARVPWPDLRHARHPRPVRGDAARRGAHPGEGPRVPGAPRQGRPGQRAAVHRWPTPWRSRT